MASSEETPKVISATEETKPEETTPAAVDAKQVSQ